MSEIFIEVDLKFIGLTNKQENYLENLDLDVFYKTKVTSYMGVNRELLYGRCLISKDDWIEKLQDDPHLDPNVKLYGKAKVGERIIIHSDGGSFNNGGKDKTLPVFSSYGTIIIKAEGGKEIFRKKGGEEDWSNNIGEMTGALEGIRFAKEHNKSIFPPDVPLEIGIITDAQYVVKGSTEWITNWKKNGWRNNTNEIVSNLELWKEMDKFLCDPELNIRFRWVKGHAGHKYNEQCDILCGEVINEWLVSKGLPVRKKK